MRLSRVFLLIAVALGVCGPVRAQVTPDDISKRTQTFYQHPSVAEAAQIAQAASKLPGGNAVNTALAGFMAAVYVKYPKDIDKLVVTEGPSTFVAGTAVALRLAGQEQRAQEVVKRVPPVNGRYFTLSGVPNSLDKVDAHLAPDIDTLWGASFATGDAKYPGKILSQFVVLANQGTQAADMSRLVRERTTKPDTRWVFVKYGRAKGIELINGSTALWSLRSNAKQHEFVHRVVEAYTAKHPDEPAAKALTQP